MNILLPFVLWSTLAATPPTLLDFERFGVNRDITSNYWSAASDFRWRFGQTFPTLPPDQWRRLDDAARHATLAWDSLDNIAINLGSARGAMAQRDWENMLMYEGWALEHLERLRSIIGWRNYYFGRMPDPIPWKLFREKPF